MDIMKVDQFLIYLPRYLGICPCLKTNWLQIIIHISAVSPYPAEWPTLADLDWTCWRSNHYQELYFSKSNPQAT